jgi:type II secretory pathway component GspD/PulD (secretin)
MVTRTYAVADLIIPPGAGRGPMVTLEDELVGLITRDVAPGSWSETGGPGTIDYFPLGMALVVNQTPEVQTEVARLLEALRWLDPQEVSIEARILSLSDSGIERLGLAMPCPAKGRPVVLTEEQLVELMENAQADRDTSVMQAPKMTLFQGQRATLAAVERQDFLTSVELLEDDEGRVLPRPVHETFELGMRLTLRPVVSLDGDAVTMEVRARLTSVDGPAVPLLPRVTLAVPPVGEGEPVPFTQFVQQPHFTVLTAARTVRAPDGGTVVLSLGSRPVERRFEYAPPVLGAIPYLGRLFTTVGYGRETEHVLLLLTPRVINVEEVTEERQTGFVRPPAIAVP